MTTRFLTFCRVALPALLLTTGPVLAQVVVPSGPLSADPGRAAYLLPKALPSNALRRTAALALPFFDDFTLPLEGRPKVQNWAPTGGALVSNRLALAPLTRGAATLDGLRANGLSYSGGTGVAYGTIDSLQSQPINLAGLTPNDRVYLSFAWQAGSIVGTPNLNIGNNVVRLELYLKTSTNTWVRAFTYNSQRVRTGFRQQVIDLNQAQYLHGDFQFMFVASGNASDNSDNWSVDYVLLDRGRTRGLADTTFVDVATGAGLAGGNPSGGLRSPLRRYTSLPVWQFNASPASELSPSFGVNLTNLEVPLPRPIDVLGTVRDLNTGTLLGNWLQASRTIPANTRREPQTGPATAVAIPTTPAPKRLRYTLALNSRDIPRAQPNDTISRDVELTNYYAYDDGTAENFTQLTAFSTGQPAAFAYRFDLNTADFVSGLRLYPVYTASDITTRAVTVSVWTNDAGRPAATPVASKTASLPGTGPLPSGLPYVEIRFDQPVPVTGSFFVGYSQPSAGRDLHYGLDLNNSFPPGALWLRSNAGAWDSVRFVPRRGALMMRPVLTNGVITATAPAREAAAYALYPNPAHDAVTVVGPAFVRASLLDAVGRTVWEQPAAQAGQATLSLPVLPPGVYTVRLVLPDGRAVARRLLLE